MRDRPVVLDSSAGMLIGMTPHDTDINSAADDMPQHDAGTSSVASNMPRHDSDSAADYRRVTVEDAAKLLGLSENAIRKRIERGSLTSERIDGTRYVLLDRDMPRRDADMSTPEAATLMARMSDEIEFLRGELQRKDTLLMSLMQRLPELEPSPEAPESPETVAGPTEGVETPLQAREKGSWLKRFFFGP